MVPSRATAARQPRDHSVFHRHGDLLQRFQAVVTQPQAADGHGATSGPLQASSRHPNQPETPQRNRLGDTVHE